MQEAAQPRPNRAKDRVWTVVLSHEARDRDREGQRSEGDPATRGMRSVAMRDEKLRTRATGNLRTNMHCGSEFSRHDYTQAAQWITRLNLPPTCKEYIDSRVQLCHTNLRFTRIY